MERQAPRSERAWIPLVRPRTNAGFPLAAYPRVEWRSQVCGVPNVAPHLHSIESRLLTSPTLSPWIPSTDVFEPFYAILPWILKQWQPHSRCRLARACPCIADRESRYSFKMVFPFQRLSTFLDVKELQLAGKQSGDSNAIC
jgi:hypothetical protein